MKKSLNIPVVLALMALISSCAVGRKLSFENKPAGPDYTVSKSATIVFQDRRKEVLSGKEKTSFCGHTNSTAQIGYNIQTKSGRPLADEFSESVSSSYNKAGATSKIILVSINTAPDSIINVFKTDDKERLLYFIIHRWESKATPLWSTIRYELFYEIELTVYNKNSELIASSIVKDSFLREEGAMAISMKRMQQIADDTFREQIVKLFNGETVRKNL